MTAGSKETKQTLLDAMRELIIAAEAAGWDVDPANAPILNAARDAYADAQTADA